MMEYVPVRAGVVAIEVLVYVEYEVRGRAVGVLHGEQSRARAVGDECLR